MALEDEIDSPFAAAVRVAGGQSAFGRIVGRRQSSVRERLLNGKPCWDVEVLKVEAATAISRHDLRPDIYPRDTEVAQ